MYLIEIQVVDLFLRFAAVGQLGLLVAFFSRSITARSASTITLTLCIICYVLLTAPIGNSHYGGLRHVLLLFTDLTPFATVWYALGHLNPQFKLDRIPKWILSAVLLWVGWLVYFFLVLGGRGILHDFNHALGLMLLCYVIYLCMAEFKGDLDNDRRNTRVMLVALCSLYMIGLVIFEFTLKSVRDSWQFSLANSLLIFSAVFLVCVKQMFSRSEFLAPHPSVTAQAPAEHNNQYSTARVRQTLPGHTENLERLMAQGAFLETDLTVNKLAKVLGLPAHQLRHLINQQMGFSNFSDFLNSYRIPWVCEQLADVSKRHLPILTLALEAGYGSIAPFNRAFKSKMGLTPTEYRDQF
nr:AraC family transcriptional regulator [uncultured Undibacterium sp.]